MRDGIDAGYDILPPGMIDILSRYMAYATHVSKKFISIYVEKYFVWNVNSPVSVRRIRNHIIIKKKKKNT